MLLLFLGASLAMADSDPAVVGSVESKVNAVMRDMSIVRTCV